MTKLEVVLIAVFACLLLSLSGCGSVTSDAMELRTDAAGGAAGAPGGAGAAAGASGGQAGGPTATGGAAGFVGGQGGIGMDAGYHPGWGKCPPSVPLQSCPIGTVLAGDGGSCPNGTTPIPVEGICIPADAGP